MKLLASTIAALLLTAGVARAGEAADLFSTRCASCHGPDGKSKTKMGEKMGAPDLTQAKDSAAEMEKVIAEGKGKMMPYKGKLSPEQIKALAAYVKAGLK